MTVREEDVVVALDALKVRHMRATPEELAAVDERVAAAERPADGNSLDVWDAGDDPGMIPPREWLLGNQFCRKFVSGLTAPGGSGVTVEWNGKRRELCKHV